jgi:hypothetical protein
MASTWKLMGYTGASLTAFGVLVAGFLVMSSVYPIWGVLLIIGGMALLLCGVAGLCGEPIFKN